MTGSNMKLFADNTTLYIEFDNPDEATEIINEDLENIQQWADMWLVKLSPSKTKLMTFTFKMKRKNIHPLYSTALDLNLLVTISIWI